MGHNFVPLGEPAKIPNRSLVARWGGHEELFSEGFVGVPDLFLRHYATLKPYVLTSGEAIFVLHLMSFKWSNKAPFPSYKVIADRMGVSDKMARRYASSLEGKGYLKRESRVGRSNAFDLTPLFDALSQKASGEDARRNTGADKGTV